MLFSNIEKETGIHFFVLFLANPFEYLHFVMIEYSANRKVIAWNAIKLRTFNVITLPEIMSVAGLLFDCFCNLG